MDTGFSGQMTINMFLYYFCVFIGYRIKFPLATVTLTSYYRTAIHLDPKELPGDL